MAQEVFTAHGYDFIADTMDWFDSADADRASDMLGEIIASFTAEEARKLHSLLGQASEGEIEWDHPDLAALESRCGAVLSEVTKDYTSQSFDGHNCTIAAG